MGGPGQVHTPGETDFSSLNEPTHKPETPLRGPSKRHSTEKVNQKTLTKEKNTVILASVDVAADVAAINAGHGTRLGPTTYMVNGRMYGSHDGTLYPISGPGFIQLSRGAFKALGVYNQFGETPRAQDILDRMGMSEGDRDAALKAHRAGQGG